MPLICFLCHHLGVEIAIGFRHLLAPSPATSYPQWAGTLPQTVAVLALSLSAENAEVVAGDTQRLVLIRRSVFLTTLVWRNALFPALAAAAADLPTYSPSADFGQDCRCQSHAQAWKPHPTQSPLAHRQEGTPTTAWHVLVEEPDDVAARRATGID